MLWGKIRSLYFVNMASKFDLGGFTVLQDGHFAGLKNNDWHQYLI